MVKLWWKTEEPAISLFCGKNLVCTVKTVRDNYHFVTKCCDELKDLDNFNTNKLEEFKRIIMDLYTIRMQRLGVTVYE